MTKLEELTTVYNRLNELYLNYSMAQATIDKRRRAKAIRDAKNDIANYVAYIPYDIKAIFDDQVGTNSLSFQHTDDIRQCMDILNDMIKDERIKENSDHII